MIYLDNAATGGFKPRAVTDASESVIRYLNANPGRSAHRLSLVGADIVYNTRLEASQMFDATPERVIFTKNCTEALNLAIFGSLRVGGHVITTAYEHNSVLRPLSELQKRGIITLDIVFPKKDKSLVKSIEEKINSNTYLIVTTAISNVTGKSLPINEIGNLCAKRDILFLTDGAQAGGHIPISMKENHISMLALAGHKGLYGIMGSGLLILADDVEISPLIYGGTGSESYNLFQPNCYPEKLESGTLNLPAISALGEGLKYIKSNIHAFSRILYDGSRKIIDALSGIEGIKIYSQPNSAGIVSFELANLSCSDVADRLNLDYDIAVRSGLHCAPLCHKILGTEKGGLVRASLSAQNSASEISQFISAVWNIATN